MAPASFGSDLLRVFVYGTLKPGECNYAHYCAAKVLYQQEAIAHGQLFHLPPLGYPAVTAGDGAVRGYLLCFGDRTILHHLDSLEDYDPRRPPEANEYLRQWEPIFDLNYRSLGSAWVYRMVPERVKQLGGIPVQAGVWTERRPTG